MITASDVLELLKELYESKNKEYTKDDTVNQYRAFEDAAIFCSLGLNQVVDKQTSAWLLLSKHLANVVAFLRKTEVNNEDLKSAITSANDLSIYFAIMSSMCTNELESEVIDE